MASMVGVEIKIQIHGHQEKTLIQILFYAMDAQDLSTDESARP